jgi:hypothetical protein
LLQPPSASSFVARLSPTLDEQVEVLPRLTSLNLGRSNKLTDPGLADLATLTSLTELKLFGTAAGTDAGAIALATMPRLTALDLGRFGSLTNVSVAALVAPAGGGRPLATLGLAWCGKLTDAAMVLLGNCATLTALDVTRCSELTDKGIAHVASLPSLRSLRLAECPKVCAWSREL